MTDIFSDSASASDVPTGPSGGDLFAERNPVADRLRVNASITATKSSDASRHLLDLQQKTGLPSDLIERNLPLIEQESAKQGFDAEKFSKESPVVASWMSEHPDHYKAAEDDKNNLTGAERLLSQAKDILVDIPTRTHEETKLQLQTSWLSQKERYGSITPPEKARLEFLRHHEDPKELTGFKWFEQAVLQGAMQTAAGLAMSQEEGQAGALAGAAAAGLGGPVTWPTMPATALSGYTVGTAYGMFKQTQWQEAGAAREEILKMRGTNGEKIDPVVADLASDVVGLVNAPIEFIGLGAIARTIPGAKELFKNLTKNTVKELLQKETVMTSLKEVAKRVADSTASNALQEGLQETTTILLGELSKKMSPGTFESPTVGEQIQRITGAAAGGAAMGFGMALPGSAAHVATAAYNAKQANVQSNFFKSLGDTSKNSVLRDKLPEQYKDLVDRMTKDGPIENVYTPVEFFQKHFQEQGLDPADVAKELGFTRQYEEALNTGGKLAIPTSIYATHIAPTDHNAAFSNELSISQDQMSEREQKDYFKQQEEEAKAAEANKTPEQVATLDSEVQQVMDQIRPQIEAMYPAGQSAAHVALIEQRIRNRALRSGVSPLEQFNARPLEIKPGEGKVPTTSTLKQADESLLQNPMPPEAKTKEQKAAHLAALSSENMAQMTPALAAVDQRIPGVASKANIKSTESIIGKANRPEILKKKPWWNVEHIKDSFRWRTVVDDVNKIGPAIAETLREIEQRFGKKAEVLKFDTDKMKTPGPWGWRMVALDLKMPNGQIAEYYFPTKEMHQALEGTLPGQRVGNHELFEKWRNKDFESLTPEEKDAFHSDSEESKKWYDKAMQLYYERTGQTEADFLASLRNLATMAGSLASTKSLDISSVVNPLSGTGLSSLNKTESLPANTNTLSSDLSRGTNTEGAGISDTSNQVQIIATKGSVNNAAQWASSLSSFGNEQGAIKTITPVTEAENVSNLAAAVVEDFKQLHREFMPAWIDDHINSLKVMTNDLLKSGLPASALLKLKGIGVYVGSDLSHASFSPNLWQIAFQPYVLQSVSHSKNALNQRVARMFLAHEIMHGLDSINTSEMHTHTSPDFKIGGELKLVAMMGRGVVDLNGHHNYGPVLREAIEAYRLGAFRLGNKYFAVADLLGYPMHVFLTQNDGSAHYKEFLQRETFAQLGALYYNYPDLMKRTLPKGYAMMEAIHNAISKRRSASAVNAAVQGVLGSNPSGRYTGRVDLGAGRQAAQGVSDEHAGTRMEGAVAEEAGHQDLRLGKELSPAVEAYRKQQENVPLKDVVSEPIQNKDGTYRRTFETYLDRAKQHITVEAIPSVTSGLLPEIHNADVKVREAYTREAIGLLLDKDGNNQLFAKVGIPLGGIKSGSGSFEGRVNPNAVVSVVAEKTAEGYRSKEADLAAKALMYIYTQDAVPWFQLDPTAKGASRGVAITFSSEPAADVQQAFLEHLHDYLPGANFSRIGNELFIVNFGEHSASENKTFIANAENAANAYSGPGSDTIVGVKTDVKSKGNYHSITDYNKAGWESGAALKKLEGSISEAGRPDLLAWIRDRRRAVGQLQEKYATEIKRDGGTSLYQKGGEVTRGAITTTPSGDIIQLFREKNLSTLLHELGHRWLFELQDDAALATAPQQTKDDLRSALGYLGVDTVDQLKPDNFSPESAEYARAVEANEKWARSWEAYLMEGKAPSSALRSVFAKFKAWMVAVYKAMKQGRLDEQLSPEIRGVFDRLVASDEEISAAQEEANTKQIFSTAEDAGMSPDQFSAYQKTLQEANEAAREQLDLQAMKEYQRSLTDLWKSERDAMREQVTAEVDKEPIYQTIASMQANNLQLDRSAVKAMGKGISRNVPRGIISDTGIAPDVAAGMLGYSSGESLVKEIAAAENRNRRIERETDARMTQKFGNMLEDGTLPGKAREAILNGDRAKVIEAEIKALNRKAREVAKLTKPAERAKAEQERAGRDLYRGLVPKLSDIREHAAQVISGKPIRELNPMQYYNAARVASRQAMENIRKGDYLMAAYNKGRELLNLELYREANKAKDAIESGNEKLRKVFVSDIKQAKTRDMNMVNAARAILASHGLGKSDQTPASYLEKMRQYDAESYENLRPLFEPAIQSMKHFKDMTVAEYLEMRDAALALVSVSRRSKQMEVDGKLIEREEAVGHLVNRMMDFEKNGPGKELRSTLDDLQKTKIGLLSAKATLRRVESWVTAMDGGPDGAFRRFIWNPVVDSVNLYRDEKRKVIAKYLEIVQAIAPTIRPGAIEAQELGFKFRGKNELLHALLHTGNDSNKSKLLIGYGWGERNTEGVLNTSRWDAFEKRMRDEGILTKADYDFAQNVWDMMESMKPKLQAAHKSMYGHYFNEVTANEFTNEFGTYKGGYIPAKVDVNVVAQAERYKDAEAVLKGQNSFAFPTTGRGATMSRVEGYARPLQLDMRTIPAHIDWAMRFAYLEPAVKDVARVVMDKDFASSLNGLDPTTINHMLNPWLQRTAQQITAAQGMNKFMDRFWTGVRGRSGMQVMVGNVINTLQQYTGLTIAFTRVKPSSIRTAFWMNITNNKAFSDEISEKSSFMRNRIFTSHNEVMQTIDDLLLNPSKYEKAKDFANRHGYFMQQATQGFVDKIVWHAAYSEALAGGQNDIDAVRHADSTVRETQGSFAPEDISRFEAGTPFVRAFSMFYNYFNMQANLIGTEFSKIATNELGLKKGAGRALYLYTFAFMIPAYIGNTIIRAIIAGQPEPDDDKYMSDLIGAFFESQYQSLLATIPVLGPVVNTAIAQWNHKWFDDHITASPAITAVESAVRAPHSIYKAIVDDGNEKRAVKDTLNLIGMTLGVPAGVLSRPLGYLADVHQGKANPEGPMDVARGLISGQDVNRRQ